MVKTINSRNGFYCQERFVQWGIVGGSLDALKLQVSFEKSFAEMVSVEKEFFYSFITSLACMLWTITTPIRDIIVAKFNGVRNDCGFYSNVFFDFFALLSVVFTPLLWITYLEGVVYLEKTNTTGGVAILLSAIFLSLIGTVSVVTNLLGIPRIIYRRNKFFSSG